MKLHENKELFRDAIIATAQQKNLPEIYVEKDYWITFALHIIFNHDTGNETVFKGGTALSKCFGLIERFSEDIDLVVLKKETETGNQLKAKIKKISNCVIRALPEIKIEGITKKFGMIRKTVHQYERLFEGDFGQVRNNIIIEATWFGDSEPHSERQINTFIYEMMFQNHQLNLIHEYGMSPFTIKVLSPKRTLCEKIMSLVRFSYSTNPITDLSHKIRHAYDIHLMLKDKELSEFFNSKEFNSMLLRVAGDDVFTFKNNKWISSHPKTAILFSETENVWNKIKSTYTGTFSELVFGELPNETEILQTLNTVSKRLETVEWKIKV